MSIREYVLDVLVRVFQDNGYASLLMRDSKLNSKDMALVSEIVYGTIRNYDFLEYQWRRFSKKHVKKRIALLLDMSIYQMQFLDSIPEYAIINEANELAGKHDKAFVNAILHNVSKSGQIYSDKLNITYSHPEWLINMWRAHYGEENTLKLLEENQNRSYVFGRINTLKISKEELDKGSKY